MIIFYICLGCTIAYYVFVVTGTLILERDKRRGLGRNQP